MASLVKRAWTEEEDVALTAAVHKYGACRWSMIAAQLSTGRIGKQCRERWSNHLCPEVKKSEWSEEEDSAIMQGVAVLGTRWCEIIKTPELSGRTDNAIKNRFYTLQRKMKAKQAATERTGHASSEGSDLDSPAPMPSQTDRIVSLCRELAFAIDEGDRDHLIQRLTATLHEGSTPVEPEQRVPPRIFADIGSEMHALTTEDAEELCSELVADELVANEPSLLAYEASSLCTEELLQLISPGAACDRSVARPFPRTACDKSADHVEPSVLENLSADKARPEDSSDESSRSEASTESPDEVANLGDISANLGEASTDHSSYDSSSASTISVEEAANLRASLSCDHKREHEHEHELSPELDEMGLELSDVLALCGGTSCEESSSEPCGLSRSGSYDSTTTVCGAELKPGAASEPIVSAAMLAEPVLQVATEAGPGLEGSADMDRTAACLGGRHAYKALLTPLFLPVDDLSQAVDAPMPSVVDSPNAARPTSAVSKASGPSGTPKRRYERAELAELAELAEESPKRWYDLAEMPRFAEIVGIDETVEDSPKRMRTTPRGSRASPALSPFSASARREATWHRRRPAALVLSATARSPARSPLQPHTPSPSLASPPLHASPLHMAVTFEAGLEIQREDAQELLPSPRAVTGTKEPSAVRDEAAAASSQSDSPSSTITSDFITLSSFGHLFAESS